jgi:HEAT repeat protein
MSANDRMIAYHMARLKDKNPGVRKKSIEELALLEATQAYDVMEDLYHNDPDSEVRKAAQKAGRALFLKIKTNENNNSPSDA